MLCLLEEIPGLSQDQAREFSGRLAYGESVTALAGEYGRKSSDRLQQQGRAAGRPDIRPTIEAPLPAALHWSGQAGAVSCLWSFLRQHETNIRAGDSEQSCSVYEARSGDVVGAVIGDVYEVDPAMDKRGCGKQFSGYRGVSKIGTRAVGATTRCSTP
jgi:hypothetical protein